MKQKLTFASILFGSILFFTGCEKEPIPVNPVANAGNSQTIQLPITTTSVAGAGSTTNGSIVGYLWTLVSGPNVPVISSPSSASTNVSGLIAGTYILQFSVTDNVGLSGVDTMSLIVLPPLLPPVANAGPSPTIQLPTNSIAITGSGTTTNGNISGYLWSVVSGPNVPGISATTSASTNVTGLVAGTYVLQLAVTDNAGLIGVDTMSILVKPVPQQTLTIQPANNPNDTHIDSYNLIGGAGDQEIEIAAWTINGTPTNWRVFLKFDQSQIPANATIVSATLYLYTKPAPHGVDPTNAHSGSNNAFYVERITSSWSPTALHWNTQPTTTATNRVTVPQSTSASVNATINVTAIVQDMKANGNNGFAFRLQNETYYNARQYASSYYANAALHPKLVIVYQ